LRVQNAGTFFENGAANMAAEEIDDVALAARLERIKKLTDELARVQGESEAARELAKRIKREVDAARAALKNPNA
jgi:ABC-type Fe3+-hydroxamate transport system substrate-binding protein